MGLIGHGLVQNWQTENSDDMAYIIHKVSILANDKKLFWGIAYSNLKTKC